MQFLWRKHSLSLGAIFGGGTTQHFPGVFAAKLARGVRAAQVIPHRLRFRAHFSVTFVYLCWCGVPRVWVMPRFPHVSKHGLGNAKNRTQTDRQVLSKVLYAESHVTQAQRKHKNVFHSSRTVAWDFPRRHSCISNNAPFYSPAPRHFT